MAAWAAERLPRFQVYLWAFLITGLPRFVLLALGVPWWMVLASCLVGGFASGFLNPILGAVIYERVPDAVMGRVTTINSALCWSLMPFGGLLGGVLVRDDRASPPRCSSSGSPTWPRRWLPLAIPAFRQFDRPQAPRVETGAHRGASTEPSLRGARDASRDGR